MSDKEKELARVTYQIGKRDAVAETLMMARDGSPAAVLRALAGQMIACDPEHPHALWVLANITEPKENE